MIVVKATALWVGLLAVVTGAAVVVFVIVVKIVVEVGFVVVIVIVIAMVKTLLEVLLVLEALLVAEGVVVLEIRYLSDFCIDSNGERNQFSTCKWLKWYKNKASPQQRTNLWLSSTVQCYWRVVAVVKEVLLIR